MKELDAIPYTNQLRSLIGYKFEVVDVIGYDFVGRASATAGLVISVSRVQYCDSCRYVLKTVRISKKSVPLFRRMIKELERLMSVTKTFDKSEIIKAYPFVYVP